MHFCNAKYQFYFVAKYPSFERRKIEKQSFEGIKETCKIYSVVQMNMKRLLLLKHKFLCIQRGGNRYFTQRPVIDMGPSVGRPYSPSKLRIQSKLRLVVSIWRSMLLTNYIQLRVLANKYIVVMLNPDYKYCAWAQKYIGLNTIKF